MPSQIDIDKAYQDSITALKQINDELFYQELKTSLSEYLELINSSYFKTSSAVEGMTVTVNRIPILVEDSVKPQVEKMVKEVTQNSSVVLKNFEMIQNHFLKIHQELTGLIREQKQMMQSLTIENKEILERENQTKENILEQLEQQRVSQRVRFRWTVGILALVGVFQIAFLISLLLKW